MGIESEFEPARLAEATRVFQEFDTDHSNCISREELAAILRKIGRNVTPTEIDEIMRSADLNQDGKVDFQEFLAMVYSTDHRPQTAAASSGFAAVYKHVKANIVKGHGGAQHAYTDEEKIAFVDHINSVLGHDESLSHLLPIDPATEELFTACRTGILLAKLINSAVADTIDERVLVTKQNPNRFEMVQNCNVVINSAKAIGCTVISIHPEHLIDGVPHLILGLTWQIVRIGLLSGINLQAHPELVRLLLPGEELQDLLRLPPEQLLIRWVNYHLAQAGSDRRIANFSNDIKDSVVYTILLSQISRGVCDQHPLEIADLETRAEGVLENAARIECRKFVTARDIVRGNAKLNLAFVANLFNNHPALDPPDEETLRAFADLLDFDSEGTREERAYRFWLQNLGLEVNNLYEDVKDGILLLKAFDKIAPGSVDWKRVTMNPRMVFQKGENCNYAVGIGKSLKFSLVGIDGADIAQGNRKLILALVWQMMRYHLVASIKKLSQGGRDITDAEILAWANGKVRSKGKSSSIASLSDPTVANGRFLLDLCDSLAPGIVNYEIIKEGVDDEERQMNAKYAISVARAMGVLLFTVWEDLVDCNPKMVLSYLASLMLFEKQGGAEPEGASGSGSH